ncbi:hypothetical protein V494_03903 [Pseudogymnoascus sp. VKM F-4513 (FW-928)]|nr:hypothetical protein V494_03903 [Pseudogymnoascus sp. VKM F-4513 (FW-928)]
MSQPTESTRERRLKPMTLNLAACRADDVSLMEQAISAASKPDSIYPVQYVVQRGLSRSSSMGAVRVLTYLLNHLHGASIAALTASRVTFNEDRDKPSLEVLEILVAHGWDINPRSLSDWPLLWHVVRYPDLVKWCLDHGARVDVPDDPPKITGTLVQRSGVQHGTILSMAASHGSIETFELLRANGAPLDPSPLHDATSSSWTSTPYDARLAASAALRFA